MLARIVGEVTLVRWAAAENASNTTRRHPSRSGALGSAPSAVAAQSGEAFDPNTGEPTSWETVVRSARGLRLNTATWLRLVGK